MLAGKHVAVSTSAATGLNQIASYHIKETSGTAAAVVNLRDGGAAGTIIVPIRLASAEFADMQFAHPLLSTDGWYFELVSGAVSGAVSGR